MIVRFISISVSKNGNHAYYFFILAFFFLISLRLNSQTLSAEQVYEKVKDAVVVVLAYDYSDELAKQGSGVVLNDKGYVVTNYHILSGCERLEIMHGDEIIPYVDIIGIDVEKDILILKIEEKKFPSVKLGDVKSLKVGQRVYAIGSPMGFENTISEGIISGLRSYEEYEKNFIQISASISFGSSGGAVVNDKGELIGISTLTAKEGQNLNFAIPIDAVLGVEIGSYSKNDAYKDFELFYKGLESGRKGNHQEAIIYFSQYINKFPNDAEAYYNRGVTKYELEDYRGVIQDLNEALEINPIFADAYNNRGCAKITLKDFIGAIQDYDKAIEINPHDAVAYFNRGNVKAKLEDYREAIQDFNKAIEINPNYAEAYNNRGNAKDELEDFRGAIQDFSKAIEINENDASAYLNRGIAKYNLGNKPDACLDWSKAGELGDYNAYDLIKENCN